MSTRFRLLLPPDIYGQMIQQAQAELPNECCGWLAGDRAGDSRHIRRRFPLKNTLASPTRYACEFEGMLEASRAIREAGLDHLAIYHSHPTSPPVPSKTDLRDNAENHWGDCVIHFIISLAEPTPTVDAWWLLPDSYQEAEWEVVEALS